MPEQKIYETKEASEKMKFIFGFCRMWGYNEDIGYGVSKRSGRAHIPRNKANYKK